MAALVAAAAVLQSLLLGQRAELSGEWWGGVGPLTFWIDASLSNVLDKLYHNARRESLVVRSLQDEDRQRVQPVLRRYNRDALRCRKGSRQVSWLASLLKRW